MRTQAQHVRRGWAIWWNKAEMFSLRLFPTRAEAVNKMRDLVKAGFASCAYRVVRVEQITREVSAPRKAKR